MSLITGGELLLKCLQQEGVRAIFGVLDGSHNAILQKLEDYGMRYVCARHEAAAAHMAEAWARVRGEPGVVLGGIGPGAANMVSGVATAFAEGSPLIALSGQRRRNIIAPDRGGGFQVLDLASLYRPVTKWSGRVHHWRRLPELLRKAYRIATSGRPGPVFLEIPEDILRGSEEAEELAVYPARQCRLNTVGAASPAQIAQAAEMLTHAQRPLLHAGSGVVWGEAWEEFVALGEHLGAAMTVTLGARGVVPEDHPQYFHLLNREALVAAQTEADVVLAVGTRFGELDGWGKPPLWGDPTSQKVIQVDIDPTSIGLNRPVTLGILGEAKSVLAALLKAVKDLSPPRQLHPGFERYQQMRAAWQADLETNLAFEAQGIIPGQMIRTVRDHFPRQAITVIDGGNTSLWSVNYHPIYSRRGFLYSAHFGHLGSGLPYAIGAKLASPDRPVYLITGDGALGFNIQELETASRYNAAIVVIVSTDLGWGMERASQMAFGIQPFVEVDHVPQVRYDRVAQGFGCHGELVRELAELRPALERATACGKPALIQVMVDPTTNLAPPGIFEFTSLVYRAQT